MIEFEGRLLDASKVSHVGNVKTDSWGSWFEYQIEGVVHTFEFQYVEECAHDYAEERRRELIDLVKKV